MRDWTEEDFIGGHVVLDFVNTVDNPDKVRSSSRLVSWSDFSSWSVASGLFTARPPKPADEDGILAEVHDLRETVYGVLSAHAAGDAVPVMLYEGLDRRIKAAIARAELAFDGRGSYWVADPAAGSLIVDTIALAIEDLLRSGEMMRLKECGRCSWLFLDHGRGRGRRWCKMRTCGNRAKVEAFRSR